MSKEIVVSGKSQRYRCRETTVSGRAVCGWHRIKYISPSTYHYNIAHHTNRSCKYSQCHTRNWSTNRDCGSFAAGPSYVVSALIKFADGPADVSSFV